MTMSNNEQPMSDQWVTNEWPMSDQWATMSSMMTDCKFLKSVSDWVSWCSSRDATASKKHHLVTESHGKVLEFYDDWL